MVARYCSPLRNERRFLWRMFDCSGALYDQHVSVAPLLATFCLHIPCPGESALCPYSSGQTMMATPSITIGFVDGLGGYSSKAIECNPYSKIDVDSGPDVLIL